jgi:hypothetical protein
MAASCHGGNSLDHHYECSGPINPRDRVHGCTACQWTHSILQISRHRLSCDHPSPLSAQQTKQRPWLPFPRGSSCTSVSSRRSGAAFACADKSQRACTATSTPKASSSSSKRWKGFPIATVAAASRTWEETLGVLAVVMVAVATAAVVTAAAATAVAVVIGAAVVVATVVVVGVEWSRSILQEAPQHRTQIVYTRGPRQLVVKRTQTGARV